MVLILFKVFMLATHHDKDKNDDRFYLQRLHAQIGEITIKKIAFHFADRKIYVYKFYRKEYTLQPPLPYTII